MMFAEHASYAIYFAYEIQGLLKRCIEKPQLKHGYWATPDYPLVGKVGGVDGSKSNPVSGPFIKEIYLRDVYGKPYRITVEDLKEEDVEDIEDLKEEK